MVKSQLKFTHQPGLSDHQGAHGQGWGDWRAALAQMVGGDGVKWNMEYGSSIAIW